jgi:glucose/arabinose dehydrogenase
VRRALLAACLLALVVPARSGALGLQPVGSFDQPIFVTSPPGDPRLFVVERPGRIQVLHDGARSRFLDIHDLTTTDGERGLLSMAFDPNYAGNRFFYVFYTGDGPNSGGIEGDIHIERYRASILNPNVANPNTRTPLLVVNRNTTAANHNGGQLQFGKDGRLYASVGDAANGANAQNPFNPNGKILRLNPDGSGAGVWSLGLRNPFRFSFDHLTGDMVIGDVGAGTREEIDFAPRSAGLGRGANYGWPCREGFVSGPTGCTGSFTNPVFDYAHSAPCNALIGGYVYRGSRAPEIAGRYLYTDNCHPGLRSLVLGAPLASGDRSEGLTLPSGPFSFGEDARCDLYVASGSGPVSRIVGATAGAAPACATSSATPAGTAPPGVTGQRAAARRRCKRKYGKAVKRKRARDALSKPAKRHLKKRLRKCKRKARKLPV